MKRFDHIDFLRAVAIIGVIITHILSLFLGTPLTNTLWNYMHFVVPIFVYCSGFIIYERPPKKIIPWYIKRTKRLLMPFIAWTTVHYLLGLGLRLDFSWLPILFLELMIVTPIYVSLWKTHRIILIVIVVLSTFFHPPIDYHLYMWLPWSSILLISFIRPFLPIYSAVIAFLVFAVFNIFLLFLHQPLTLTLHKYPPDIFYLSYGVMMGSVLLLIAPKKISHIIRWLSTYSYELFFVHYIVLDIILKVIATYPQSAQ